MRWTKAFAMVVLLIGVRCFAQTPTETLTQPSIQPGYSITVTGPAVPIRLGSPTNVIITVTNVSGRDLYMKSAIGNNSVYKDFKFLLTKDGREVDTTFFHRKLTGKLRPDDPQEAAGGGSSSIVLPHPPGKVFEIPIDLNRLYQITQPGLYTLNISSYDEVSKVTVRSNTLTLKIRP